MVNNINIQAESSAVMLAALQAVTGNIQQDPSAGLQEPQQQHENGEVYNMTSGLFPCVCVAMYETLLSPQYFEESLNEDDDPYCYTSLNFDDWKKNLTKVAGNYIQHNVIESLRNYGCMAIDACSIWSPKFYNYYTDELVMDITMQQGWQNIMKEKIDLWRNRADVNSYISKNWHSYSGYVNLMPESLDEILSEHDEERQLAAYLTLAMLVEGTLKDSGDIMECLYYDMDFSDYNRVNVLYEYMDDYEADRLLRLYDNDVEFNELYWDLVEKIGFVWLHEGPDMLRGKEDPCVDFRANSDGERLLFWAVECNYTVDDLYNMAA